MRDASDIARDLRALADQVERLGGGDWISAFKSGRELGVPAAKGPLDRLRRCHGGSRSSDAVEVAQVILEIRVHAC